MESNPIPRFCVVSFRFVSHSHLCVCVCVWLHLRSWVLDIGCRGVGVGGRRGGEEEGGRLYIEIYT